MVKWVHRVAVMSAFVCVLLPAPLLAQSKIRIAIWNFENNAERSWWFHDDLGPAARNQIDTAFSENTELARRFSVIERQQLELVLKEQGLATFGAVDPQSAAKVGRLLGVQYIVVGGVDKFSINKTSGATGRFGGVGGNMVSAEAVINMRFIDATTAERVLALSAEGDVRKGGGVFRGTGLSRDAQWGIASEAIEKASSALVTKLASGGYLDRISAAAGANRPLEGKIIKVDGDRAWINLGSAAGLKVGDTLKIVNVGDELIDPDTGAKLGATETESGAGEVVDVQEKFAVIKFTGTAGARDVVRK
jgi:curli biogenesis system outer membrane secretion channel CsgG